MGALQKTCAPNRHARILLSTHRRSVFAPYLEATAQAVEAQVDHRGCVQREQLAYQQATHNGNAQRLAYLCAVAVPKGSGTAPRSRSSGHHDRPKTQQAGFINGFVRGRLRVRRLKGKIHHHDGIFFDNTAQKQHANQRDNAKFHAASHQGQQGPAARRRQG